MSSRKKVDLRKLAEQMLKYQRGQRPVLNWKDARKRGYRVPKGARTGALLLAAGLVVLSAACGSTSDITPDITSPATSAVAPAVPSPSGWPQAVAGICALRGLGDSKAQIEAELMAAGTSAPQTAVDQIVTYALSRCPAPAPVVTRTVTAAPAPAVPYYPAWSQPGQVMPPALQAYAPHVNGGTYYTVLLCSAYQCTGYPHAGPDESTCGQDFRGEQVCVK